MKLSIWRSFAALLAAVIIGTGTRLDAQQPGPREIDRRIATESDVSVRILNLVGATHVIGWDRDTVAVTGLVPRGGGTFYMGGGERGIKIGIELPQAPAGAPGTALEVRVPRGARVWVKSATASVSVSGVTGEVDASTVSGDITVTGNPVLISAESMDGDLDISARAAVTRLKSAAGNVTLRGAGGEVTASSVSGDVRMLEADELVTGRLESVSGKVFFDGGITPDGSLDLQTHDAPIEIFLASNQGASLEVSAFGGRVTNRIIGVSGAPTRGKAVRFIVGSGTARVAIRSLKGDVLIRRRVPRPNDPT